VADADRGLELHLLRSFACLFCACDRVATPDPEPTIGSPVFCGQCGALMVLDDAGDPDELRPELRRVRTSEREELLRLPAVRAVRDAYALDDVERRMRRVSSKDKSKPSAPRVGAKARLGRNRLEARGPDA
jgi:hypothetical protein